MEVDRAHFRAAAALPPLDVLGSFDNSQVLVINEAQRLPEASRIIKGWHDVPLPVKILLLGSSSLNLLDQAVESLTGRNRKLTLPPLLFSETLAVGDSPDTARSAAPTFCLPAAGLAAATVGLRRLSRGRPDSQSGALAARVQRRLSLEGCPANWPDQDAGSHQASALAAGPPDQLRGIGKRAGNPAGDGTTGGRALPGPAGTDLCHLPVALVQHQPTQGDCQGPQGVFWDTGICNALLNAFATEELRPDISLLWENWTIAEIAKRNALLGAPAELFFWHSRTQSEVDLVVKQDGCLRAFEIKWSGRRTRNRAFRDTYGVSVETIGLENPFVADLLEA